MREREKQGQAPLWPTVLHIGLRLICRQNFGNNSCTENNAGIIRVKTGIFYSRTVPGSGVKSDQAPAPAQGITRARPTSACSAAQSTV